MKLEVGKKYKNFRGEEVKIVRYDEGEMNYTDEGVYSPFDQDSEYNLVEEVPE